MIVYAFNKDKDSIKSSFQWLASLVLGGSDNLEGDEVSSRLKARREETEKMKLALESAKQAKKN
jgi:hypothetical protein